MVIVMEGRCQVTCVQLSCRQSAKAIPVDDNHVGPLIVW